jgi:DNA-directed RNA polymerase specialized sigma24 family protein
MTYLSQPLYLPERQARTQQIDAEEFSRRVLHGWMRRTETTLNHTDHEDALAYLIAVAWQVSLRYDPARGVRFDSYLYSILSHRCTDWLREDEGRTRWQFSGHEHVRERPTLLSLDAPRASESDERELGELVAAADGRDEADRDAALEWLERSRDRERARDLGRLRAWLCEEDAA